LFKWYPPSEELIKVHHAIVVEIQLGQRLLGLIQRNFSSNRTAHFPKFVGINHAISLAIEHVEDFADTL
jgi:hypothetical protein